MAYDDDQGQRWFAAKNECEYEIPGYGLIQFHDRIIDGVHSYFLNNFDEETDIVWEVERPTDEIVSEGNPARFCFNGPTPIPPKSQGGRGRITQGFPAQVLHDGSTDSLPNGRRCGPKADSFYCWSTGTGFACIGHDGTQAVLNDNGVHTVWLARGLTFTGGHAKGTFAGTYDSNAVIPITFSSPPTALGIINITDPPPTPPDIPNQGFIIQESGMYQFGWQASASSPDAVRGWPLTVRAYVKRKETPTQPQPTIWQVMRYQQIESDVYYGRTDLTMVENMAMSGWENLKVGDELYFVNTTSTKKLMLAVGSAWAMKVKPYFDESTPDHKGLAYP